MTWNYEHFISIKVLWYVHMYDWLERENSYIEFPRNAYIEFVNMKYEKRNSIFLSKKVGMDSITSTVRPREIVPSGGPF